MKTQEKFCVNDAGEDMDLAIISPFKVTRKMHSKLKNLSALSGYKMAEIIRQMISYSLANMDTENMVKVTPIKVKMNRRGRPTQAQKEAKRKEALKKEKLGIQP